MLKDLKSKLKGQLKQWQKRNLINVDTELFNDPKAKLVDWIPLKPGGSNFKTNNLVKISQMLYQYNLSTQGKLFIGVFLVVGILSQIAGLALVFVDPAGWGVLVFGLIFTGASYLIFRFMAMPVVFNYSLGIVWKGRKAPKLAGDQNKTQQLVYFSDIYAIQILKERVYSKNRSYYSYELNLVLDDNSRFNLIDHGNIVQIRQDAEVLSGFLGKPIWDASKM